MSRNIFANNDKDEPVVVPEEDLGTPMEILEKEIEETERHLAFLKRTWLVAKRRGGKE